MLFSVLMRLGHGNTRGVQRGRGQPQRGQQLMLQTDHRGWMRVMMCRASGYVCLARSNVRVQKVRMFTAGNFPASLNGGPDGAQSRETSSKPELSTDGLECDTSCALDFLCFGNRGERHWSKMRCVKFGILDVEESWHATRPDVALARRKEGPSRPASARAATCSNSIRAVSAEPRYRHHLYNHSQCRCWSRRPLVS